MQGALVQEDCPGPLSFPGSHFVHEMELKAFEYLPLSHDLQGLPFPVLKRPGPHGPHAVFESAPS